MSRSFENKRLIVIALKNLGEDVFIGYYVGQQRVVNGVKVPLVTDNPRLAKRYPRRVHMFEVSRSVDQRLFSTKIVNAGSEFRKWGDRNDQRT